MSDIENSGKLLTNRLLSRMSTITVLSYAFTFSQIRRLLLRLSKKSRKFFERYIVDFKAMTVLVRATPFWGKLLAIVDTDQVVIWPPEIRLRNKNHPEMPLSNYNIRRIRQVKCLSQVAVNVTHEQVFGVNLFFRDVEDPLNRIVKHVGHSQSDNTFDFVSLKERDFKLKTICCRHKFDQKLKGFSF